MFFFYSWFYFLLLLSLNSPSLLSFFIMTVITFSFCKTIFFYSKNKLCSSISYSFYVLMFACNSNRISLSTGIKEQLEFLRMCLLWSLCVSCAVTLINYAHLSPSKLQQFVKAKDSKTTVQFAKGKWPSPFQSMRIQSSCTRTPYGGLKCFLHHLFLLNPTWNYYCSFHTLILIKHVFTFYICHTTFYCCHTINYNNTLESCLLRD